jgi:hypothetical protein
MSPPVLRALMAKNLFKMYIAAQEWIIVAVLQQEEDGKVSGSIHESMST